MKVCVTLLFQSKLGITCISGMIVFILHLNDYNLRKHIWHSRSNPTGHGTSSSISFVTSHMTSISEIELDIRIPLCNVQHLNGILKISLEIFPKKTH